jgi:hypothetical protein
VNCHSSVSFNSFHAHKNRITFHCSSLVNSINGAATCDSITTTQKTLKLNYVQMSECSCYLYPPSSAVLPTSRVR